MAYKLIPLDKTQLAKRVQYKMDKCPTITAASAMYNVNIIKIEDKRQEICYKWNNQLDNIRGQFEDITQKKKYGESLVLNGKYIKDYPLIQNFIKNINDLETKYKETNTTFWLNEFKPSRIELVNEYNTAQKKYNDLAIKKAKYEIEFHDVNILSVSETYLEIQEIKQ